MERVLYWCFLLFAGISAQLDVGDRCNVGIPGKCTFLEGCPIADKLSHTLKRCGWRGHKEIICCPLPELPKLSTSPFRKSVQACLDYAKETKSVLEFDIYGGVKPRLGEFPHMAVLGFQDRSDSTSQIKWRCGGVLISENFVLTTAHCLVNSYRRAPVVVRLGTVDLLGNNDNVEAQDIRIAEKYTHPEYDSVRGVNNIALVRLEKAVNLTDYVRPACLYTKNDTPPALLVTGWGKSEDGTIYLQKEQVELVEPAACKKAYEGSSGKFTVGADSQLCTRSGQASHTCPPDSGGPIQIKNHQNHNATPYIVIGIGSFGPPCGGRSPSVYTRVYSYLDWIESIVWPDTEL